MQFQELTISSKRNESTPELKLLENVEKPTVTTMFLAPSGSAFSQLGGPSHIAPLPEQEWNNLSKLVTEKLANFYRSLGAPVTLTEDGQIHLSEYAMIPERPYVIKYAGDIYEFVRTVDNKIVISEIKPG
jgi:hypothetical protein